MPPPADATLLFFSPAVSEGFAESPAGCLELDAVGAVTVLGTTTRATISEHACSLIATDADADADADAVATQRRPCLDPSDDLFQKIR